MSGIQANRFFQQIYNGNQPSSSGFAPLPGNNNALNSTNRDGVTVTSNGKTAERGSDPIRQLLGEIRGY